MIAKMRLCTINKEKLKKSTVIDIESVTILNYWQIVEQQILPGQTLAYFKQPNVRAYPLRININSFISKPAVSQVNCMEIMEKFVIEKDMYNTNNYGNAEQRIKVITRRHVLLRLLTAPFFISDIPIIVIRHKHIIYISLLKVYKPYTPLGKQHCEFPRHCETNSPPTNTTTWDCMQANNAGFFIFGAKFGEFDLFYSAEANAVMSDKPVKDVGNMDALNNCRFISVNILDEEKFPYWRQTTTVFKWWCKGYLSNIKHFFIGFKDANGIINKPALLKDITYLEKEQQHRMHISKAFLHKFLNLVVDTTKSYDRPDTIMKYDFDKQSNIRYSVHNANEFPVFSADFTTYLQKQAI